MLGPSSLALLPTSHPNAPPPLLSPYRFLTDTICLAYLFKGRSLTHLYVMLQEAALRTYYIKDDQQDYELQTFTQQALLSDDIINRNDASEEICPGSVFRESVPEAWIIRAKPKDHEVLRIYPAWLK